MRHRLAAVFMLGVLVWLPTVTAPQVAQAASVCSGWTSTRVPPSTIRVLRTGGSSSGYVQTVDFKKYVQIVLAAEWPPNWPAEALKTGAIAVKQYGWYNTMHWRGGTAHGTCYDVIDNSNDQVYQPETRTPSAAARAAIEATWNESVTRNGSFLMTGYRPGTSYLHCGVDADGWHLFQHSSLDCANEGMKADQILRVYYGPGVVTWTPATKPAANFLTPAAQSQVTVGASATVSWAEETTDGTTVTNRTLSLLMALPINRKCSVDRWVPASPSWQSTGSSPQTITGLRAGYCYRLVVQLTDSNSVRTLSQSGTMLVDPSAATAAFTSPAPNVVTPTGGTTATVSWTETPAGGTHIVSRQLATEWAAQPVAGTCTGAQWSTLTSTTAGSPVSVGGLLKLDCYRYRLTLTDSAGHTSTTYSGELLAPSA
jgi:hypothetical protein